MYRTSFPKCIVEGSFDPVNFGHMILLGSIPKKCNVCTNLFEGSCTRAVETIEDYQQLDYGPCPKRGETFPIEKVAGKFKCVFFVPKKCSECEFLSFDDIPGYVCNFQKERWKDFPRNLDWGGWSPRHTPIGIKGRVIATDEVTEFVLNGKKAKAVKEMRRIYPPLSLEAAIKCVRIFSEKINS